MVVQAIQQLMRECGLGELDCLSSICLRHGMCNDMRKTCRSPGRHCVDAAGPCFDRCARGVAMFKKVECRSGIVENMSYFFAALRRHDIFAHGGARDAAANSACLSSAKCRRYAIREQSIPGIRRSRTLRVNTPRLPGIAAQVKASLEKAMPAAPKITIE